MNIENLLVRPKVREDESAIGFSMRLAHLNGLSHVNWLLRLTSGTSYRRLRICTACCTQDENHWLANWERLSHPWCERHRCWLIDTCESCGVQLSASTAALLRCHCGKHYASAEPLRVEAPMLHALSDDETGVAVLVWFGKLSMFGTSLIPGKRGACQSLSQVRDFLSAGLATLEDWPNSFLVALDRHRVSAARQADGEGQRMSEAFPRLETMIERLPRRWRTRVGTALSEYTYRSQATTLPLASVARGRLRRRCLTQKAGAVLRQQDE